MKPREVRVLLGTFSTRKIYIKRKQDSAIPVGTRHTRKQALVPSSPSNAVRYARFFATWHIGPLYRFMPGMNKPALSVIVFEEGV